MEPSQEELRKKKITNLAPSPFQQTKFTRTSSIRSIIQLFSQFNKEELVEKNEKVSIAGRILRIRSFGNLIFANLVDQTGKIQLKISKNKDFAELDVGDIIGVKGIICKTDKGELSVEVKEFILLSKCLKPLPDIHYGFNDLEERFRKRYLDFIINSEKREILIIRHQIIQNILYFLCFLCRQNSLNKNKAFSKLSLLLTTHLKIVGVSCNMCLSTKNLFSSVLAKYIVIFFLLTKFQKSVCLFIL